jgi:hypothetical protein
MTRKRFSDHEKWLLGKYGTTDISKIFKKIDRWVAKSPYRLGEIGLKDGVGYYALSHVEDAAKNSLVDSGDDMDDVSG